jgi:hypothetical protein
MAALEAPGFAGGLPGATAGDGRRGEPSAVNAV